MPRRNGHCDAERCFVITCFSISQDICCDEIRTEFAKQGVQTNLVLVRYFFLIMYKVCPKDLQIKERRMKDEKKKCCYDPVVLRRCAWPLRLRRR